MVLAPRSAVLPKVGLVLADRLGARFRAGFVLYTGEQALPFGDRLKALPMASLWTLDSAA
ncbi:hypothetical protein [Spongiactinospora sp. TRM90649]|uniref:hypothetical protein n=1 Tax=Spongiactinospora sp. TRM90649 TaxID=3031114 RepID=UPI0023F67497|nr:hypothetical protein [Spongiactinospora sp. TRM90649]MDF5757734.1 hypothetical protein [Spongiactinospora sp. TRM90649]